MTHFYRLGCASGATRISRTWYRVLSEDQLGSVHEAAEFHCFGHRRSLSCALCVRSKPIECDASASCSPRTLRQTALVKCVSIPSSLH